MDWFGYPVGVVERPSYPTRDGIRVDEASVDRQRCQWTMYKDPTTVPEEIYRRAGRTKPTAFGSDAMAAAEDGRHTSFLGGG